MKKILLIILISSLAGCATVNSLRNSKPLISGVTNKSAQKYSACVVQKWNETYFHATSVPLEDGYSIQILNDVAGADAVLDVREKSGATHYELYERAPSFTSNKVARALDLCK